VGFVVPNYNPLHLGAIALDYNIAIAFTHNQDFTKEMKQKAIKFVVKNHPV
jgi:hypothetical protein